MLVYNRYEPVRLYIHAPLKHFKNHNRIREEHACMNNLIIAQAGMPDMVVPFWGFKDHHPHKTWDWRN